jgi:hypothetical protein
VSKIIELNPVPQRTTFRGGGALASGVALLCYVLLHRSGMPLDPDGWALWQGAVSLATGQGYTYFSGNPIAAWPPLYSAYLALWTLLLGPTGWSLLVANGLLVVLQAFLWMKMAMTIARDAGSEPSIGTSVPLSILVGLVVALHQREVLGQNLVYSLLPLYVLFLWKLLHGDGTGREVRTVLLLASLGALLCLAHNTAVVFVVAAAAMVGLNWPVRWRFLAFSIAMVAVPGLCALAVRFLLGQPGSHRVGIGAGRYDGLTYGLHLFEGIGRVLAPEKFGASFVVAAVLFAVVLVLLPRDRGPASGLRFSTRLTAISMVLLVLLFTSVWVASPLSGRHVLFVVLIVGPFAYIEAARVAPLVARVAIILLLLPQLYWAGLGVMRLEASWRNDPALGQPTDWLVPPHAYLSRHYRNGPPVETAAGLLIAPYGFEEPRGRTR